VERALHKIFGCSIVRWSPGTAALFRGSPGTAALFRGQVVLLVQPRIFEVSQMFLLFDLKLNKLKQKISKQKQNQLIFTLTSGLPPTKRLV